MTQQGAGPPPCYTRGVSQDPQQAAALQPPPEEEPRPSFLAPLVFSVVLAAAVISGAVTANQRFGAELQREEDEELRAVASIRAEQVASWRAERLASGRVLAQLVGAAVDAHGWPTQGEPQDALLRQLETARVGHRDVVAVAVLDGAGRVRHAVGLPAAAVELPTLVPLLAEASRQGGPFLSEPHAAAPGQPPHLDLVAPFPGQGAAAGGFAVVRLDAARVVFGELLAWPVPSHSAQVVVLRVDGGRFTVLGGSGAGVPPPLATRPLTGGDALALAARGERGTLMARRADGAEVLATALPVAGTRWVLVATQDLAESLAPLRTQTLTVQVGLGLILVVLLAAAAMWWRLQVAGWERRRERARAARAALEERIAILSRHSNDMMVLSDEQQLLVDVNERTCELLGYTREELVGRPVRDLRDPSTLPDFPIRTKQEIADGGAIFETRFCRKDGVTFPVEVSVRTAVFGGRRFFQGIIRDITERRKLELQLQLADRMASVGTLAAGVAHEINNPLAYVLANLDFALGELGQPVPEGGEVRRALDEAKDGAVRVREIVRDLKAFSRGRDLERERLDVRRVLQSAVGLAQNEIRHRARLSVELLDVPAVLGSEHRLGQVFLNLLINAAQAVPEGAADANLVNVVASVADDGRVAVEITDTGAGIPEEILPRIFDPFFTTKPVGVGTGLGLSIVHGIVAGMGGEIKVRSEPGQGTIFTVLLPPAPAEAAAPAAAALPGAVPAPTPLPAGGAKVLVVDDEPLVGRAVGRILSPPHRVTLASSGAEALALLAQHGFDVVLCDLMMPGMSGMELHDRLAADAPEVARRMIFLTGGAFTDGARDFLARVPNARIEKPFEPAALRTAVATWLSEGGPAGA
jgi:PAS domain S-box-containing protein